MIAALLLAAAPVPVIAAAPVSAPVIPLAAARSAAYRDCIASQRRRRPGAALVQIGRGACAAQRSKLAGQVYRNISLGWSATAKTAGQARRLRAQLRTQAEAEVAGFEARIEAWFAATDVAAARLNGASAR